MIQTLGRDDSRVFATGSKSMAGRRAISSPIFYAALLACGLIGLYYGVEVGSPLVARWFGQWRVWQSMRSADPHARLTVVRSMEHMDPELTTAALIEATGDTDVAVRVAACRRLASRANRPPGLVAVLSAAANKQDLEIRVSVAQILGLIVAGNLARSQASDSQAEATAVLCRLLHDPQSEVRALAAYALGEGGAGSAPAELVAAADDPDHDVRLAVARALRRTNGPNDPTVARLLCRLLADPNPIADRFQILKMVQETSKETQDRAMKALAGLMARADDAVLPDVIACLGESGPRAQAALPLLDKLLDAPESSTRAHAAMAMLAIDEKPTPRVLAVLLDMMASKELRQDWRMDAVGRVRESNPKALAKATPALIRQLGDQSPDIRRAAVELLSAIIEDTPAEIPAAAGGK